MGGQPATVEVAAVEVTSKGSVRRVEVELRFTSTASLTVDPATWTLLTDQGNEYPPTSGSARAPRLKTTTVSPGHSVEGWLAFDALPADTHGFLDLVGTDGTTILAIELY